MLQDSLFAFHRATWDFLEETGRIGLMFTPQQWESTVLAYMGPRTRQSCHDVTWVMSRMGMIEHLPRKGVIVLKPQAETDESLADSR